MYSLQADASLEMEQRHFCQASLEYVFLLQEVQERKKFEFVETVILLFIYICAKSPFFGVTSIFV